VIFSGLTYSLTVCVILAVSVSSSSLNCTPDSRIIITKLSGMWSRHHRHRGLEMGNRKLQIANSRYYSAQNFNFAPNSTISGGLQAHTKYCISGRKLSDEESFLTGQNLGSPGNFSMFLHVSLASYRLQSSSRH